MKTWRVTVERVEYLTLEITAPDMVSAMQTAVEKAKDVPSVKPKHHHFDIEEIQACPQPQ